MKHLLLSLLLMLPSALRAQSANPAMWCPAGATWTYGYQDMGGHGAVTAWYAGDTLVGGQRGQKLLRRCTATSWSSGGGSYTWNLAPVITRTVADRVEVQANGQFYTLYDFAAGRGSTWLTPMVTPSGPCASGLAQVTVDSVGQQVVGGRALRWFRAHLTPAAGATTVGGWTGRIYEQLGSVAQYMQPQSPSCHGTDPGYLGPLASFQATAWPTISYNSTNGTLLSSTKARTAAAGFAVYPNPSAGAAGLRVALPVGFGPAAQLRLLDLAGRLVLCQPAQGGQLLDVDGLAAGIYSLQLSTPGAATLVCRVVLE